MSELLHRFENIKKLNDFTSGKISDLEAIVSSIKDSDFCLVYNGSYARKEASEESDFDYFLIFSEDVGEKEKRSTEKKVWNAVEKIIGKMPAPDGAFGESVSSGALAKNIGGKNDGNENITRRILFLTEGVPLGNKILYEDQLENLINRYIQDDITDHQLALFFLNDVIRYYRTMCVDFENKTGERGKEWGIRNIKLVFSRKLLYFGGVLMAAETAQRTLSEKREILKNLSRLTALERLSEVCGESALPALRDYDLFLSKLSNAGFREMLKKTTKPSSRKNEEFKRLKNVGHYFTFHLISALKTNYSEAHPIHRVLIM